MKGSTQIAKGRIEESAGVLVGNDQLRRKGRRDQSVGQVKKTAQKVVDTVAEKLGK